MLSYTNLVADGPLCSGELATVILQPLDAIGDADNETNPGWWVLVVHDHILL